MRVYVTVGADDLATANAFWESALATIGWSIYREFPGCRAYSEDETDKGYLLWVCKPYDGKAASAGNGQTIGFVVDTKSQVDLLRGCDCQRRDRPRAAQPTA